ncbi:MAG TPA: dTDP-4-dehydrorhamnose 3,5-epimerase [Kiritimatiellia bacterium]|nr:dTDP-4-dehydrorhamnose 3,5-epimerase [Kiritimatiellia bacterium]
MAGTLFIPGNIAGVVIVDPAAFPDNRGFFTETFHQAKYVDAGIPGSFVQDNYSHSNRHVLRGLHYQKTRPQGKLVYVVQGEVWDVIVDMRKGSPTFGQWEGVTLTGPNRRQVYVPEGCAHGFVVLSETADVMYKCTALYAPQDEQGLIWNDPGLGITWPVADPVVSAKDQVLGSLADIPEADLPVFGS